MSNSWTFHRRFFTMLNTKANEQDHRLGRRYTSSTKIIEVTMKKKIFLSFVLLQSSFYFFSSPSFAQYSGGSGTVDDPYQITNAEDLDNLRHEPDAHFRLTSSIDLGTAPWNEENGWGPLGTSSEPFTGSFDGNGYQIRNLTINRPDESRLGLFGTVNQGTLKNIRLVDVMVIGGSYSAGLAGQFNNSTMDHIFVSGDIVSESPWTGGVTGSASDASIHNVVANVTVQSDSHAGGLAGSVFRSRIRHSYTEGSIAGGERIGGLIGSYNGSGAAVADCYSHASVTGNNRVGGLIGYMQTGFVFRTFSTGPVAGSGENIGGIIGLQDSGSTGFSLWDTHTSGRQTSAGGEGVTGRSTDQMQLKETFTAFNFSMLWNILEDEQYPVFRNLTRYEQEIPKALSDLQGNGTPDSPYLISNEHELSAMRLDLEANYRLDNDIDLSASLVWNGGTGWLPIGSSSESFTGTFDGAGFKIFNLAINRPNLADCGLFSQTQDAILSNVHLENIQILGSGNVGGLLGRGYNNLMKNISGKGLVAARSSSAGGLYGSLNRGSMHNSWFEGRVYGLSNAGGLIGGHYGTDLRRVHSTGSVQWNGLDPQYNGNRFGGLMGHLNSANISDAYSHSRVSGKNEVGGLIGYMQSGRVERAFSTGMVSADQELAGGLIGHRSYGQVVFCYWDAQSSGQSASEGGPGVTGKTTLELQSRETYGMFNFFTQWMINDGLEYPVFQDISHLSLPEEVSLSDLPGQGTPEEPYLIGTADALNAMHLDLEASYRLTADIDLSSTLIWNYGHGWLPVGGFNNDFDGTFDGAGHVIRNLTINRPEYSGTGLFGYTRTDVEIRDLKLEEVHIQGGSRTGALAGNVYDNIIENISVTGIITGTGSTGGVVGSINLGKMHNTHAVVDVYGLYSVGGLIGAHFGTDIRQTYTMGNLYWSGEDSGSSMGSRFGGLFGHFNSATIWNSYSKVNIHAQDQLGGLIGYMQTGTIWYTYSTGSVNGNDERLGGLIGYRSYGDVRESYWDIEASGQSESDGGYGRTTEEMTYPRAEDTFGAWNFLDIWKEDNSEIHGGYPYLQVYAPIYFTINATVGSGGGTAEGSGEYGYGALVTLKATASEGYEFVNWTEGSEIVSKSYSYTFIASNDHNLVANFQILLDAEMEEQLPIYVNLNQNYPNPFNPVTTITYSLPEAAEVRLEVYNLMGQRVAVLVSGMQQAGVHSSVFDAGHFASGVYLYHLQAGGIVKTRKMTLVK